MKAAELRIGNWVAPTNDEAKYPYKITAQELVYFEADSQRFKPIPLTEEWLLKFGFENTSRFEWCLRGIKIHFYDSGEFTLDYFGKEMLRKASGKYLHQLQNLYFALTRTELPTV